MHSAAHCSSQFFYKSLFGLGRQETRETKEPFVTFSHRLIGNRTHVPSKQQGDREAMEWGENRGWGEGTKGVTGVGGTKRRQIKLNVHFQLREKCWIRLGRRREFIEQRGGGADYLG